ncbi:MAG: hemolysin III family protein [Candidatus Onthomonas sp.]|nr:hemolysin III family protein [Candidatus Onthomonas sp.]
MEMARAADGFYMDRRQRRRELVRQRNEPPRLTVAEEVVNAVTHGAGALLAVAALVLLLLRSRTALEVTAACFYGVSMLVMMLMSCLYHAMPAGSGAKRLLRRFDYSSIYLLIGGTFAPILLVYYGNSTCIALFCVQWAVILFGITLIAVFGPGRWRALHFTLYFLIGWSGVAFIPDFYQNNQPLLWWILAGGLVYTLGMIPFARNRKYDHCFWHVLVLTAAFLHWFGIYTCIPW